MPEIYQFDSPDLAFLPAHARDSYVDNTFILGTGSLGNSIWQALKQASIAPVRTFDIDTWERRNVPNTLGIDTTNIGENKAHYTRDLLTNNPLASRGQPPSTVILATDNLLTRAHSFKLAFEQKVDLILDMRSSKDHIRTIVVQPWRVNELDPDLKAKAEEQLKYLYPPVTTDTAGYPSWAEDGPDPDEENHEGGCSERGSIMHTLTAISRATQLFFRQYQPDSLPAVGIYNDFPWTGSNDILEFRNAPPRELVNHTGTYTPDRAQMFRSSPIVKTTLVPSWTQQIPEASNQIRYRGSQEQTEAFVTAVLSDDTIDNAQAEQAS